MESISNEADFILESLYYSQVIFNVMYYFQTLELLDPECYK